MTNTYIQGNIVSTKGSPEYVLLWLLKQPVAHLKLKNTTEQDADKKKIKYKQPIKLPTMKLSGTLATRSRKWCLVEDGHYVATRIRRVYFYKVQVCVFTILPKKLFLQMGYQ